MGSRMGCDECGCNHRFDVWCLVSAAIYRALSSRHLDRIGVGCSLIGVSVFTLDLGCRVDGSDMIGELLYFTKSCNCHK